MRPGLDSLLARGVVSGGDLEELAALLRAAFGAQASVLNPGASAFNRDTHVHDVPASWVTDYLALEHLDPLRDWLSERPLGTVFCAHMHAVHPELERAFRRAGWSDSAIVLLPSPLAEPTVVVLYRRAGIFGSADVAELSRLAAPLAQALGTRTALAAMKAPPDEPLDAALRRVVSHATVGVPSGRCRWAADAGVALGRRAGAAPLTRAELERLEPVLRAVVARAHGPGSQRFAFGLRAELAWAAPEAGDRRRALVLFVADPEPSVDARAPVLEALTPRQRAVALAVARGLSLPAVGRELGVSAETVRTHLRAALDVLGLRTRAELARLLTR